MNQIQTKPHLLKRIFAGLIDYSLIFGYLMSMIILFGEPNPDGENTVTGIPAFSVVVIWFIFTVGMEQWMGATLGNYLQNLRPVSKRFPHEKITFSQSFKRHLLDMMDFQIFGLVGVLMITKTEKHQRLGDLWAETIVVERKDTNEGYTGF